MLHTILRCNSQLLRTCPIAADGLSSVCSILAFQHLGFLIVSLLHSEASMHKAQPHATDQGNALDTLQARRTKPLQAHLIVVFPKCRLHGGIIGTWVPVLRVHQRLHQTFGHMTTPAWIWP